MPTYDYRCAKCGNFEFVQKITEDALKVCPTCGGTEIERLISATAFHLKGSGWYKTDYGSKNTSVGSAPKDTTASTASTSAPETKPAETKTESKPEKCNPGCACS